MTDSTDMSDENFAYGSTTFTSWWKVRGTYVTTHSLSLRFVHTDTHTDKTMHRVSNHTAPYPAVEADACGLEHWQGCKNMHFLANLCDVV